MRTKPTHIDYDALPPKEQRDAAFYETFGGYVLYYRMPEDRPDCPAPKYTYARLAERFGVELTDLVDAQIQYKGHIHLALLNASNRKTDRLLQRTLQAALGPDVPVPLPGEDDPLWEGVNAVSASRERLARQLAAFADFNRPGSDQRLVMDPEQLLTLTAALDPTLPLLTAEEQAALDALLRLAEVGAEPLTEAERALLTERFYTGGEDAPLVDSHRGGLLTLSVEAGRALCELIRRRMTPRRLAAALARLRPELAGRLTPAP